MWMALSKISVFFMTAYGRGIVPLSARWVLGGVLVTDLYAGYRFVDASGSSRMLWRFMSDDDIPLTNNEAERARVAMCFGAKGVTGCVHILGNNCFVSEYCR